MEYQARWVALLAIVIVVGAFGALLIDRRTRVWGAGLIVAGMFGLLLFAFFSVHQVRSGVGGTERMSQAFQSASGQVAYSETPGVPLPPGYGSDPAPLTIQQNGVALLPLLLIGGTVGLLIALALRGRVHIHGHLAGLGGLAVAAVVVGALLTLVWMKASAVREVAGREATIASETRAQSEALKQIREAEAREPSSVPERQYRGVIPAHAEAEENPKTAKTEPSQPKEWRAWHFDGASGSERKETSSNQPDWIDDDARREGDNYIVVVRSGTFPSDPILREQKFGDKIVAVVRPYIDGYILHQSGATDALGIDKGFLQKYVTDRCYYPSGEQAVRLSLGTKFVDEIEHQYKQFLSVDRVRQAAVISLVGFLMLGGAYAVLRVAPQDKRPAAPKPVSADQGASMAAPVEPSSPSVQEKGTAALGMRWYYGHWLFWSLVGLLALLVLSALGLAR